MYNLQQLEKQQIGLKIPQYLIEEIDNFTKQFSVNRTDIVIEALRSYISIPIYTTPKEKNIV